MRITLSFAIVLSCTAMAAAAQQAAPPAPSAATLKTFASSADVAALAAKAKADRKPDQALVAQPLLQLAPYNVNLEYRAAVGRRHPDADVAASSQEMNW